MNSSVKTIQEVGGNIRLMRTVRHRTLVWVQGVTGIDISRLSRIENGYIQNVSLREIALIADALEVSMAELLNLEKLETESLEEEAHLRRLMKFGREEYRRMNKNTKKDKH